jgi:hypothetical protein
MSRNPVFAVAPKFSLTISLLLAAFAPGPLLAQYPGHIDRAAGPTPNTLRAIAVLEYSGELTHPTASRLVPVAVWDGANYQPAALYLAQPEPLAVQPGTQYILEQAGTPKGFYDVKAAADVAGSWIATGSYQAPIPPHVAHLRPSKVVPQFNDDKPHFAHVPTGDTTEGAGGASPAPAVDPDRPTLHRRSDSGGTASAGSGGSASSSSGSTGGAGASTSSVDPDRPALHPSGDANPGDNGAPVSATTSVDPDRPRLGYGRPAEYEKLDVPTGVQLAKIAGSATGVKHAIAVSDASTRQSQSFVYSWSDPSDEGKARSAMELAAQKILASQPAPARFGPATQSPARARPAAAKVPTAVTSSTSAHTAPTAHTARPAHARTPAASGLPLLADESFHAFQLTFGAGATLVFSAASGEGDNQRYITLIAEPDFNGVPQILFKQVTSHGGLDITPRMQLVDAVDTNADNRGELIFELAGSSGHQYGIYRVAERAVEQVFVTGG